MNEDRFLEAEIGVFGGAQPIRFAHKRFSDLPKNHHLHINNHCEIFVFIEGNVDYMVGDSYYSLKRGDVVVIGPHEVHKALIKDDSMYERFYFLVDCHALDCMSVNPMEILLNKPADEGNLVSFDEEKREEMIGLLYDVRNCFAGGRREAVRAFSDFLRFLDAIAGQYAAGRVSAGTGSVTPRLLGEILTYIEENTAAVQSVGEVAGQLGVTPQYLSSYFSAHIGTPLKTYIQAKKITLAKDLLDRGADVTEACYGSGFNECSYFIKVFRRYVGTTPLRYQMRK